MPNFAEYLRRDIRLLILRILAEMPTFSANSSVLNMGLQRYGHAITRDQVKTELRWLEEQGLLTIADISVVLVATLNERGQDVATGRGQVHGIAKPGA